MVEIKQLKERIESAISDCKEIIAIFEREIEGANNSSFQQIKEIETTILRLERKGLQIPDELKQLKLRLLTQYEYAGKLCR